MSLPANFGPVRPLIENLTFEVTVHRSRAYIFIIGRSDYLLTNKITRAKWSIRKTNPNSREIGLPCAGLKLKLTARKIVIQSDKRRRRSVHPSGGAKGRMKFLKNEGTASGDSISDKLSSFVGSRSVVPVLFAHRKP
jgi:hypothetical protein